MDAEAWLGPHLKRDRSVWRGCGGGVISKWRWLWLVELRVVITRF